MKIYDNIITGERDCIRPNPLNGKFNPSETNYSEAGYRERVSVDLPSEGFRVVKYAVQEIDTTTSKLIVAEQVNIAEEAEAARQAKLATITPMLKTQAGMFRTILRTHFGDGAETNHDVTYTTVFTYFAGKQIAGTITAQEVADMFILDKLYNAILAWTADGTTWSFPWEVLT